MPTATDFDSTFPCPHCGSSVPDNARRCRSCGASEEYGWGEESYDTYDDEDDFDYDSFVAREFPEHAGHGEHGPATKNVWMAVIVLAVIASLMLAMF